MVLIDTDICIELLRGNRRVLERRKAVREEVAISFMSVAELYYGVFKSKFVGKNRQVLELFLLSVTVIHSDQQIMEEFGRLKETLHRERKLVPDADLFIAATCLKRCTLLVTGNQRHFGRIKELRLDNWLQNVISR